MQGKRMTLADPQTKSNSATQRLVYAVHLPYYSEQQIDALLNRGFPWLETYL